MTSTWQLKCLLLCPPNHQHSSPIHWVIKILPRHFFAAQHIDYLIMIMPGFPKLFTPTPDASELILPVLLLPRRDISWLIFLDIFFSLNKMVCRITFVDLVIWTIVLYLQYIPRNIHTVFALLCFVVVIHWLIFPYPSGLLHWHCGNLTIAPVPAKQPSWIWINTSWEFIMNDCITTTKHSTTKPCAYFLGYTVCHDQVANYVIYSAYVRSKFKSSKVKIVYCHTTNTYTSKASRWEKAHNP